MKRPLEQIQRLLPTLQHLARFPSCNWTSICSRNGVSLQDVHAVVKEACGSLANWDEDYLELLCNEHAIPVPKYPEQSSRPAPALSVPAKVAAPAPSRRESPPPPASAPKPQVAPREAAAAAPAPRRKVKPIKPVFLDICRRLLADPKLSENAACSAVGVGFSTWGYFKKVRLGGGLVDRAKIAELLSAAAAPVPARPVGRPPAEIVPAEVKSAAETPAALPATNRLSIAAAGAHSIQVPVLRPALEGRDVLAEINAMLAGYRLEVVAVRLVPKDVSAS